MKIRYSRTNQDISLDEGSLQEEMLIYLFYNYMTNKPKNARKIPDYLSLEEFKTTNSSIADGQANKYVKIHNAASEDLQTKKLKEVLEAINLQAPAKKTLQALINLNKDITIDGLINSSIDKLMQNPDADADIREKREEGLTDDGEEKLYSNYIKLFGKEKPKSGDFVTIKGRKFKENIKYIKIKEHDKLTEKGSKVDYLKKLGFAPISVVESRATKKTGRKGIGQSVSFGGKGNVAEREKEISGGSLLSTKPNAHRKVFERLFLQLKVNEELFKLVGMKGKPSNYSNKLIMQMQRSKIQSMEILIERLKKAASLTKPLKEDKFEMVLSPEDIAFNNKHFNDTALEEYALADNPFQRVKGGIDREFRKINKIPALDSQGKQKKKNGKLQYHIKREGEKKKVGEKGEYIVPDFDDLSDLGKFEFDDGESFDFNFDFFQFERLKEIKETLDGANERLEEYNADDDEYFESERVEEERKILDALKDLTKQAKVKKLNAKGALEQFTKDKEKYVKDKQISIKQAKKAVQTGKLPENYRGKSFIDPKDGKTKKWNMKNFSELFGKDGERRPDSEKKEFPMPTKEVVNVPEKIKNLVTPEEAEDAYKNGLMDWIKRTFSKPLGDLSMLYEYEFQVVETIVDKGEDGKQTTYSFSVALSNPTHEINTKAVNIGVGTDSQAGKALGKPAYSYKNFKYDRDLIRNMKVFADSTKKKFKKISSSLL